MTIGLPCKMLHVLLCYETTSHFYVIHLQFKVTAYLQRCFRCKQCSACILRSQYTFTSEIFFKCRFFGSSNHPNEISNVKMRSLKKIKCWQINGSFKFRPEVKITRLTDIFSILFSNQFFHLKQTLLLRVPCKTHGEFVRLHLNFDSR